VIVMVGIPNRGKTYISRKVARYLRWISYRARVFSLAKYRLDKLGSKPAIFFNPANNENTKLRDDLMMTAMEDLIRYLNGGGEIAILDGTNCTKDRRRRIRERVALEDGYEVLWIECLKKDGADAADVSSFTEDVTADLPDYLKDSPDYMDKEDFLMKIKYYESIYEPLEDDEGCSVRLIGSGLDLKLHQIHGYLRTKVASFLMNLHTTPRPVYMTRHGESVFNVKGLIGGGEACFVCCV
jgi:predicted kinase